MTNELKDIPIPVPPDQKESKEESSATTMTSVEDINGYIDDSKDEEETSESEPEEIKTESVEEDNMNHIVESKDEESEIESNGDKNKYLDKFETDLPEIEGVLKKGREKREELDREYQNKLEQLDEARKKREDAEKAENEAVNTAKEAEIKKTEAEKLVKEAKEVETEAEQDMNLAKNMVDEYDEKEKAFMGLIRNKAAEFGETLETKGENKQDNTDNEKSDDELIMPNTETTVAESKDKKEEDKTPDEDRAGSFLDSLADDNIK